MLGGVGGGKGFLVIQPKKPLPSAEAPLAAVVLGKAAQFSLPAEAEVGSLTSRHSFIHVCAQSNARVYN